MIETKTMLAFLYYCVDLFFLLIYSVSLNCLLECKNDLQVSEIILTYNGEEEEKLYTDMAIAMRRRKDKFFNRFWLTIRILGT